MTPPLDGLTFFLDRGLGSRIVAKALREQGWRLETMDERYGKQASQNIQDVQWISEATSNGDVLLCKDLRIASNPLEARCIYMNNSRVFGLKNRHMTGPQMADLFISMGTKIGNMARGANGPYVVSVSSDSLKRRKLLFP
ncbi:MULTISPECIES: hypothetical protein [unclassified Nocardiopsis]|uniref:PIN-like domain-containing protein n=1 Tax=unclassified Nocardiopsis TaxID=2649073 RepID=UPI001300D72A|nr:hypothetical protein [Nocardiopsis sp. TSRI0078]